MELGERTMTETRVLPPGEEQPLDCKLLTELVRNAIYRTLEDLKNLSVPQQLQGVNRVNDNGMGYYEIASPNYGDTVVWERVNQTWCSEESIALTDYIWDCSALKQQITGPDPNKESWARWTYNNLVHHPLLVALEETTRERLVDYGVVDTWAVDTDKIEKAVEDVVAMYGKRSQLVTTFCPLRGLKLLSEDCLEIAPDIRLRRWTTRDLCLLLSRHRHEYLWDDFKAPLSERNIAEINFPIKMGKGVQQEDVEAMVRDRLDLLKWSLLITRDQDQPVAEGTCLFKGRLDIRMGRFRRDENFSAGDYTLDDTALHQCIDLIQRFRSATQAVKKPDDLYQALWHFGRACVASLPRDILLESAIGLDSLLVPGGGDSRYRFCLHGAAILSTNMFEGETHYQALNQIYELRSRAAHGGRVRDVEKVAPESRKKLAQAIRVIADLILTQKLSRTEGIAEAVQHYVRQKATSGAPEGL
jgi:hypothetical protein